MSSRGRLLPVTARQLSAQQFRSAPNLMICGKERSRSAPHPLMNLDRTKSFWTRCPKVPFWFPSRDMKELFSSSSYSDCCSFRRDFVLKETTATVKGKVVDDAGNPVSGALVYASTVRCKGPQFIRSTFVVTTKTDSQGRYEVQVAPDGSRWLVAWHEEFKEGEQRVGITEGLEYT